MNILGSSDIMSVFDVILIVYGIYTMYSAFMMKKTGVPGKWLMGEQDTSKCRDLRGFVDEMTVKTVLFGASAVLYGVISTVNRMKLGIRALDAVCIIVFLAVCAFYVVGLNRAKKKFF